MVCSSYTTKCPLLPSTVHEISLSDLDEINKKRDWSLLLSKWLSNLSLCLISQLTVKHYYMVLP